ncbi:uncharacterized protein MAM_07151 [Metarhizium album ARSEF 1941]|uniref:Hydrophobin n=1 Tax=Metarhizium album (strain ARSEF 1941) TaxID=1081103 RepID=A0A0B2WMK0_METAS|nr:uncharacterized protein MAM_07151 [Metarhizium album ARSEF 1941]KHN94924.1 Hydrophobin, fungi [Metarhizium album ARSEF 1941]
MFAKTLIVALAAVAAAVPTAKQVGNVCGNDQKAICCNTQESFDKLHGLVGGLSALNGLLQCSHVSVLSIVGSLADSTCTNQVACCQDVEQNGLVNLACNNVAI